MAYLDRVGTDRQVEYLVEPGVLRRGRCRVVDGSIYNRHRCAGDCGTRRVNNGSIQRPKCLLTHSELGTDQNGKAKQTELSGTPPKRSIHMLLAAKRFFSSI